MTDKKTMLSARMVAAYVGNNTVEVSEIPNLIQRTYQVLANLDAPVVVDETKQTPAISIKKSVSPDAVICLECGKKQVMLRRHVATAHGLSVAEYRTKWSLPTDYPMVAPDYASRRSEMAIKIGLGRKPKNPSRDGLGLDSNTDAAPHRYPASRWSKPSAE